MEEIKVRFGTERKKRLFDVVKLKIVLFVTEETIDCLSALHICKDGILGIYFYFRKKVHVSLHMCMPGESQAAQ